MVFIPVNNLRYYKQLQSIWATYPNVQGTLWVNPIQPAHTKISLGKEKMENIQESNYNKNGRLVRKCKKMKNCSTDETYTDEEQLKDLTIFKVLSAMQES